MCNAIWAMSICRWSRYRSMAKPRRTTCHASKMKQPDKRFATVEELGALSVFLASEAAASITSTTLLVDGGWTSH